MSPDVKVGDKTILTDGVVGATNGAAATVVNKRWQGKTAERTEPSRHLPTFVRGNPGQGVT